MPVVNRLPVGSHNDEEHHSALIDRQCRNDKVDDTSKSFIPFPIGSTVVVNQKMVDHGPMEQQQQQQQQQQ